MGEFYGGIECDKCGHMGSCDEWAESHDYDNDVLICPECGAQFDDNAE